MMLRSIALTCLLAVAIPAAATPPVGSRLGSRLRPSAEQIQEEAAAKHGHELAQCLASKRERPATRLLASATAEDYESAYKKMMDGELQCYSGFDGGIAEARSFSMPTDVLRGMVAEELLKKDRAAVRQLSALPRQMTYHRPWFFATGRDPVVDEMATCVAETDPVRTSALLETRPYSDEERAAFGTLGPVMGPCLRIGAKLSANRQALRAALADALYQRTQPWTIAPEPVQQGAGK